MAIENPAPLAAVGIRLLLVFEFGNAAWSIVDCGEVRQFNLRVRSPCATSEALSGHRRRLIQAEFQLQRGDTMTTTMISEMPKQLKELRLPTPVGILTMSHY